MTPDSIQAAAEELRREHVGQHGVIEIMSVKTIAKIIARHAESTKITTEREAYLVLHKACPIEVGDKVRVLRMPEDHETGWGMGCQHKWKREYIGKIITVEEDGLENGFIFTDCLRTPEVSFFLPFFVLKLVEKTEPPICISGGVEIGRTEAMGIVKRLVDEHSDDGWRYFDREQPIAKGPYRGIGFISRAHTGAVESIQKPVRHQWFADGKSGMWLESKFREITREEAMKITGGVE